MSYRLGEMYDGDESLHFILRPDTFAWRFECDGKIYGDYVHLNGFTDTPEECFPLLLEQAKRAMRELKANRALAEFLERMETKRGEIRLFKTLGRKKTDVEVEE